MGHSKRALRAELLSKKARAREIRQHERRQAKLERRRARRAEHGALGVLVPDTVGPVADSEATVRVARYGLRELEEHNVLGLKTIAKELGIRGISKLRKDELVEWIYRSDENFV